MNRLRMMAGALALSLTLGLTGCQGSAAEGDTVAVQSVSMLAGLGTVGLQNRYAGEIVAQATHEITKDEERKISELKVAVGDVVHAGDVLFTYDIDEIRFAVEAAELELEKMANTIDSDKKQITQLEKEKKKASQDNQLSYSIEIQSLQADIKEEEYNIKTKTAELERLKNTMNNTEVCAEVDGTIQSIKENDNGQQDYYSSDSSDAYITIIETGTFRVKGKVNEMNIQDIGMLEGNPVIVRSRVDSSQTWPGIMGSVDTEKTLKDNNNYYYDGNSDDSLSSSKYAFYVELEESEGLMLGQHVFIELNQGQDEESDGIRLSSYFISREDSGDYVWAANSRDKLEKRRVELGEYNEDLDTWTIESGLAAEDYIAIPDEELKEGLPVTRYDEEYFDPGEYEDMGNDGDAADEEYEEIEEYEADDADDVDAEDADAEDDAEFEWNQTEGVIKG